MKLNDYERSMLDMTISGKRRKQIADSLGAPISTVSQHIDLVRKREGCATLFQLIAKYVMELKK